MSTQSNPLRVLIAASGSGGHLLPGLYIAQAFKARFPDAQIHFVGSGRPLEAIIIDQNNFPRHIIRTVGLKSRGLSGLLQFVVTLPSGIIAVWRLLRGFSPDVIVGAGGYVSFLPVTIGFFLRIPTWIHEAELKPGLANAVLSLFATKVSTAFEQARMPFWARTEFTGHPVRPEIVAVAKEDKQVSSPKNLLVMGGSQGAKSIDQAIVALSSQIAAKGVSIWHQCRKENYDSVLAGYKSRNIEARVEHFIEKPDEAYRWADLIVCRSGAGLTMEVGLVNRPTIFVPYPFAQGNHQLANAKTLADVGKALVVEEGPDFENRLGQAIDNLCTPQNYVAMKSRPFISRSADAASRIVEGCLALISKDE